MILEYFKYFCIAVLLFIIQVTFVPYLSVEMITPDIPILFVIYLSLQRGQFFGMILGFLDGFFFVFFAGNFFGLYALTYTIAAFITGYFYEEDRAKETLQSYFFIFIMFLSVFFSNLIYFIIFIQGMSEFNFSLLITKYCLGSTVYTLIFGIFFMFIISRGKINKIREV
jgi:rod shape-determining protein MreD